MDKKLSIFGILVAFFFLSACSQVSKHLIAGDKYYAEGRSELAFSEYEKAIGLDPKLERDQKFQVKYKRIKGAALFMRGEREAQAKNWDEAVRFLHESLATIEQPDVKSKLEQAIEEASRFHYQRGLELADDASLNEAIDEFKKSLELDPKNPDSRNALDYSKQPEAKVPGEAWQKYEQGLMFSQQKKWNEAEAAFTKAISANTNLVLARIKRQEARKMLILSESAEREGQVALTQKDLDLAIAKAQSALEIYPFLEKAKALLEYASKLRKQAEDEFARSMVALENRQFDLASARLRTVIEMYPKRPRAISKLKQLPSTAAKFFSDQGKHNLCNGQLQIAKASFQKALSYVEKFPEASQGLSDCLLIEARDYWRRQLVGRSLLHAARALDLTPDNSEAQNIVSRATGELLKQCTFKVALEVADLEENQRNVVDVKAALMQEMQYKAPKNFELEATDAVLGLLGKIARTKDDKRLKAFEPPKYHVSVQISGFKVLREPPQVQALSKQYQSGTKRYPNPEYTRIIGEINRLTGQADAINQQMLAKQMMQMQQDQAYQNRQLQRRMLERSPGRGGFDGAIDNFLLGVDSATDSQEQARSGFGQAFDNLGILSSQLGISTAISNLQNQLNQTPAFLEEPIYDYWNYQIETHRKTVRCSLLTQVTRVADQKVVLSVPFDESVKTTATVTQNPNPSIGIPYEELKMPSDEEVRHGLLKTSVSKASAEIISSIQGNYANALLREGAELQRADDLNAAGEILVKFMFVVPKSNENSEQIETVKAWISAHTGLDSLPQGFPDKYSFVRTILHQEIGPTQVPPLGAKLEIVNDEFRKFLGYTSEHGIVVTSVQSNSVAEKAGLKWLDIITEIDGKPAINVETVLGELDKPSVHTLAVFRSGVRLELSIPRAQAEIGKEVLLPTKQDFVSKGADIVGLRTGPVTNLGIELRMPTDEIAKFLGIGEREGLIVTQVTENGLGGKAGLRWGDFIVSAGDIRIRSLNDLYQSLSSSESRMMPLTILRNGKEMRIVMEW
jgi:tetratricopeptide (TPR) repeat protein